MDEGGDGLACAAVGGGPESEEGGACGGAVGEVGVEFFGAADAVEGEGGLAVVSTKHASCVCVCARIVCQNSIE